MTDATLRNAPIHRRLLSGGVETLCLSPPAAIFVTAFGATLLSVTGAITAAGGASDWMAQLPPIVATTLTALLVAATAARWLGSRPGAVAGLVYLSSLHTWTACRSGGWDGPASMAVCAAMAAFAAGCVPGRRPLADRRWAARGFYAALAASFVLLGTTGPAIILAGCLGFLVLSQDARGLRFFLDWPGIVLLTLLIAGWLLSVGPASPLAWRGCLVPAGSPAIDQPSVAGLLWSAGVGMVPWTPLVLLAAANGLRQGHYATPIWRFFGCWLLAPLGVVATGAFSGESVVAALLPPMAVMASAGLLDLWGWCRFRCRL